jgi:hypothetical protein
MVVTDQGILGHRQTLASAVLITVGQCRDALVGARPRRDRGRCGVRLVEPGGWSSMGPGLVEHGVASVYKASIISEWPELARLTPTAFSGGGTLITAFVALV